MGSHALIILCATSPQVALVCIVGISGNELHSITREPRGGHERFEVPRAPGQYDAFGMLSFVPFQSRVQKRGRSGGRVLPCVRKGPRAQLGPKPTVFLNTFTSMCARPAEVSKCTLVEPGFASGEAPGNTNRGGCHVHAWYSSARVLIDVRYVRPCLGPCACLCARMILIFGEFDAYVSSLVYLYNIGSRVQSFRVRRCEMKPLSFAGSHITLSIA